MRRITDRAGLVEPCWVNLGGREKRRECNEIVNGDRHPVGQSRLGGGVGTRSDDRSRRVITN